MSENNEIMTLSELTDSVSLYADNQSFLPVSHGGRVNLNTGEFFYFSDPINIGGVALPYDLTCYFRSFSDRKWNYSTNQWLSVVENPVIDIYYVDGMGNYHLFNCDDVDKYSIDNELFLEYNPNGQSVLRDKKGNKLTFDSMYGLVEICDANGNWIRFSNDYKLPITTEIITDSFGREAKLTSTRQKLTEIIDYSNRATTFEYNGETLVKISYPDGTTTEFDKFPFSTYSVGSVKERDGIIYTFAGTDGKLTTVKKYSAGSDIETDEPEEVLEIEYVNEHKTIVKDRTKIRKVYIFDDNGRAISIYEDAPLVVDGVELEDRHELKGAVTYQYTDKKRTFSCLVDQEDEESNLLLNGSFEDGENNWTRSSTCVSADIVVSNESINDGNSFNFTTYFWNSMSDKKYLRQSVSLNDIDWKNGNTMLLSGWAKTDEGYLDLRAVVQYEDDSSEVFKVSFDRTINAWNYVSLPIVIKKDTAISIDVYVECTMYHVGNVSYVDNIRLIKAPANSVEYEKNISNETAIVFGDKVTIKERVTTNDGKYTIKQEMDENYDVVRTIIIDADGNDFISYAEYDDKHRLVYSQDYRGIITKNTYNSVGMVTSVKSWYSDVKNPSTITEPSEYFLKTMTYDETGEFLIKDGDARSDEIYTGNEYDTTKCLLMNTTNPNGQVTSYTYDPNNDLVTKVSALIDEDEFSVVYGYTNRKLTSIMHNGFDYGFTYDGMGRAKDVKIGGTTYSTNEYLLTDTTTVTTTYATGEKMKVETDRHQQPIKTTYTDRDGVDSVLSESEYDSLGRVTKTIDNCEDFTYNYKYDGFGNLIHAEDGLSYFNDNTFDGNNRLTRVDFLSGNVRLSQSPVYETDSEGRIYPDNAVVGIDNLDGLAVSALEKDVHGRPIRKYIKNLENNTVGSDTFGYLSIKEDNGTRLTSIVDSITQNYGGEEETLRYVYDDNGNITFVFKDDELIARYEYDGMNQLIKEANFELGLSYAYEYDNAGNILAKHEYSHMHGEPEAYLGTKTYSYEANGWKDKLIAFDGKSIEYDEIGNPTSYLGYDLTWDRVRQLKTFGSNKFYYTADGKRYQKNDDRYVYDNGGKLIRELRNGESLIYFYGVDGICGFSHRYNYSYNDGNHGYSEKLYFYKKNLQGDVVAIYDEDGHKVAGYVYDAWGKCTITTNVDGIATFNPIRYRGYYYDTETGLYYLNSRYYDPETGRFINADSISVIFVTPMNLYHKNLYSYCDNNPIVRVDFGGAFWHIVAGAVIGAIVSFVSSAVTDLIYEKHIDVGKAFISAGIGAVSGALTAAVPTAAITISSISSAAESVINGVIEEESVGTIVTDAVVSAGIGAVTGSWGDDVANPNLYDDAIDAISKTMKGNHPKVKKAAKKVIKNAEKSFINDYVVSQVENTVISVFQQGGKVLRSNIINYIY